MKNKNYLFTYLSTIIGAIILLLIFILSDLNCRKNAYSDISETLDYLKYQCIRYDEIADEEETKSLIRIADKVSYFKQDVLSNTKDKSLTEDYTNEFLIDQRLTGIIITNNEANLFFEYSLDENDSKIVDWKQIANSKKDIANNSNKCYVERIYSDKYCYDYAIISRNDNKGIILCYLKQDVKVVLGSQLSLSNLLDGFNIENNGMVFFTNSNYIVSSNVEKYNDVKINDCEFINKIKEDESQKDFVKIRVDNKNYYALSSRVKNYFIYVIYPSNKIFITRSLIFSYSTVVYVILVTLSILFNLKLNQLKRKQQEEIDKKYKDELNELANKAIKANSLKSDFLRRMSHDIRTPITTIKGLVEIGNHYKDDLEVQNEIRDKVLKTSGYLLDLVNDVLDMSKLEGEIEQFRNEPFILSELLKNVYEITKSQANDEGISLNIEKGKIIHDSLIGSKLHLQRVFINIINNAIKYNKKNGKITISYNEISTSGTIATFEFKCIDTGIGMSQEFQGKMFEPFEQENPNDTHYGTGLGLAIVKRIIDRIDGTIAVESKLNEGTTFTLTIPFLIYNSEKVNDINKQDNILSLEGINILLAEDNEINQEIIKFFLKNAKANVICVNNGKEAYEKYLENDRIDVILMDIIMPIMDGISSCIKIRNSNKENAKTIPIIALSANTFKDDIDKALNAKMDDYIAKPIDSNELIKKIKNVINHKKCGGGYQKMINENFYLLINEDYSDIKKRIIDDEIIHSILLKLRDDTTFINLKKSFNDKDFDNAFIYAHTLKGIASNLGFKRLFNESAILTEKLRNKDYSNLESIFNNIEKEYNLIIEKLNECYY